VRVLLLGATEFFAPFVAADLLARGWEVAALTATPLGLDKAIHVVGDDPRDASILASTLRSWRPDAVVDMLHETAADAHAVLTACEERVGRTVHLSSISVYGRTPPCPVTEDTELARSEELPSAAVDQIAADEVVVAAIVEGAPAVVLRLPAVYGPRDPTSAEWFFARRALDGRPCIALPDGGLAVCHRGFVQNMARGVAQAVASARAAGHVYNLGEEGLYTLAHFARGVARALEHEWDIYSVPGNRWRTPYDHTSFVDLRRARGHLRYRDRMIPRDGLELTLAWLCQHPRGEDWSWPGIEAPFDYEREDALIEEYGWKIEA
jgi:nucleoside-diphosphate-sugar epimerase